MILPITLTIAGAAALLNLWLAIRVGNVRMSAKIDLGDGGNERLSRRMRAHSNFSEFTPIVLILLGLIEMTVGQSLWLWLAGGIYILARISHAFGMDGKMKARQIGIIATFLITLILAVGALALPYFTVVSVGGTLPS